MARHDKTFQVVMVMLGMSWQDLTNIFLRVSLIVGVKKYPGCLSPISVEK